MCIRDSISGIPYAEGSAYDFVVGFAGTASATTGVRVSLDQDDPQVCWKSTLACDTASPATMVVTQVAGATTITSNTTSLTITPDPTVCAVTTPASLAGGVYEDPNDNGIRDPGEQPIPGVTVELLDASGVVVKTATTAADGSYLFSDLAPGTYSVRETQPSAYTDGKEAVGTHGGVVTNDLISTVVLASGDAATAYDFFEIPPVPAAPAITIVKLSLIHI